MLLNKQETQEIINKHYTNAKTDDTQIMSISIDTFRVINEFLYEIKLSTKGDSLYRTQAIQNTQTRRQKYDELYSKYFSKVKSDDKLIFSKLINYITSEGGNAIAYMRDCASNLPMCIEYKATYKNETVSGVYREDIYADESSLKYRLLKMLVEHFKEDESLQHLYDLEKEIKIEAYSSYDLVFSLENLEKLKEQVTSILNTDYFINWKFKGERDEYEQNILRYIFDAKREVNYHNEKNIEVYEGINLDTCRYVACFMQYVRSSRYSEAKTVKEKTELYNKIYPYIYDLISDDDKDIFAKLVNYLTFENENYVISGYGDFANTSKQDIYNRLELFEKVKNACELKQKKNNSKKTKNIHFELKTNIHPFSYSFTGGNPIFPKKEWGVVGQDILIDILEDENFKNWQFSGLKTPEEETYQLEYNDELTDLNFSENSYYILGYLVGKIYEQDSLKKRKELKNKLHSIAINYIPFKERDVFNKLFNHFTNEDEEGININPRFVDINVEVRNKENKIVVCRYVNRCENKYSEISEQVLLEKILKNKFSHVTDEITEDNLIKLFEFKYKPEIRVLSKDFQPYKERHYVKYEKYKIIKNILDNILDEENSQTIKSTNQESTVVSTFYSENTLKKVTSVNKVSEIVRQEKSKVKVDNMDNNEINLFDILNSMSDISNDKEYETKKEEKIEENIKESEASSVIQIVEYIENKKESKKNNDSILDGQLLFLV